MVSGSEFRQEGTTSLPSRPRGSGRERGRGVDGSESSRGLAPTLRSQQGARTQSAVKDLGVSRSEAGSHPSDRGIEMHGAWEPKNPWSPWENTPPSETPGAVVAGCRIDRSTCVRRDVCARIELTSNRFARWSDRLLLGPWQLRIRAGQRTSSLGGESTAERGSWAAHPRGFGWSSPGSQPHGTAVFSASTSIPHCR
jgi:hypothetical protein